MRLIKKIIVTLSVVMIVLGMFGSISSTVNAYSEITTEIASSVSEQSETVNQITGPVESPAEEKVSIMEKSFEKGSAEESVTENKLEPVVNVTDSLDEQSLPSEQNLDVLPGLPSEDNLEANADITNNDENISIKQDLESSLGVLGNVYSVLATVTDSTYTSVDSFLKSISTSKGQIGIYDEFDLNLEFFIDDAKKLNDRYEFELTDSEIIEIFGSGGSSVYATMEKNGVEYGKATLTNNKIILEFDKERCKNLVDLSVKVKFSSLRVKIKDGVTNIPSEAIVVNIGTDNSNVELKIDNSYEPSTNKSEVPFFKSGSMDSDGNIRWGLVFNQNIDNINNPVKMTKAIEVYDNTGDQMDIIWDESRFSLDIHNEDRMIPDYEMMQANGQFEQYNRYYEWLLYQGKNATEILSEMKTYMNVPMKIDESKYPTEINFEKVVEGEDTYFSIKAHYTEKFSPPHTYTTIKDVEVGRIYLKVPSNPIVSNDLLKYQAIQYNLNGEQFMDNASMYVVLYPGFVEGKYMTLSYMTSIKDGHEKDESFVNKVSVNYEDRGISLNNVDKEGNFQSSAKNISCTVEIDFGVKKDHLKIYEYGSNINEGLGGFTFAVYDNEEDAKNDNGEKALFVVETSEGGFSKEVPLEEGKEYFIKQIKVPSEYEIDSTVSSFKMENKNDEGYIYYFTNKKVEKSLPQTLPETGGGGIENYVMSGIFIQIVFLTIRKILRIYL